MRRKVGVVWWWKKLTDADERDAFSPERGEEGDRESIFHREDEVRGGRGFVSHPGRH